MNIVINGQQASTSYSELTKVITEFIKSDTPFAIAVNETFIPAAHYSQTKIVEGDRIEILSPMQGG